MLPNVIFLLNEGDYIGRRHQAYMILSNITRQTKSTILYYNLRGVESIPFNEFTRQIDFVSYSEYPDTSIEEIEDQIIYHYKLYKDETENYYENNEQLQPFVMIIDDFDKIKGVKNIDDLKQFLNDKLTLLQFLNMYIICIL